MAVSDACNMACPGNCSKCEYVGGGVTVCLGCVAGQGVDPGDRTVCRVCEFACGGCSVGDYRMCTLCRPGGQLNPNNTCSYCDNICLDCASTSTTCNVCILPTATVSYSDACNLSCPTNCDRCQYQSPVYTECLYCLSPFGLDNNQCLPCVYACRECSITNNAHCTACHIGGSISGTSCSYCPSVCRYCNSTSACQVCFP